MVVRIVSFLVLLLALSGKAQQYTFIQHGVENGLAQSQVLSMGQDKYGYLWVGTLGGLSKFNGFEFINFAVSDGLLSNHISGVKKLKNNQLLFAHAGGITLFDGYKFVPISLPEKYGNARIVCVTETLNAVWLGTDTKGLFKLVNQQITHVESGELVFKNVRDIKPYKNGLLLATREGLISYAFDTFKWWNKGKLKDVSTSGIYVDKTRNCTWVSTYGFGVIKLENDSVIHLQTKNGLLSNFIRGIYATSKNDLWLYGKTGISVIKANGQILKLNRTNGLSYDNVFSVTEDREGNIWLGTDGGGIFKFTGTQFEKYTVQDGLVSNLVMTIVQDVDSNYWFGTYGDGVTVKSKNNENIHYDVTNKLVNNTIWTSLKDSKGKLWICTSEGVQTYFNEEFKTLSKKEGLITSRITSIFEDSKGRIWLGSRDGISVVDSDSIVNYYSKDNQIGNSVRCFSEDDKGSILCGTDKGLFGYNGTGFKPILPNGSWCDKVIQEIKKSRNGWWIGTANGLHFYDGEKITCVPLNQNFSSNYINFIEIQQNKIWVGTNNGLFSLEEEWFLKTGKASAFRYSKHDGFSSLETNLHASYTDYEGNLWFGTADGVFKYNSMGVEQEKGAAPVVNINDLQLFLETPNWSKKKIEIDPKTGLPSNLKVGYKDNYFTFFYTGLSYTNPTEIKYQFMLEGFDENWLPPTSANFATYSNLPHGKYMFKVKGINKFGQEGAIESFSFEITPPYYLTWWFYLLCFFTFCGISYAVYKKTKQNIARKKQTQLLIDQSKMLGLEHQTLNASMNRHFIFNSLNSIQYYINRQDKLAANKYLTRFAKLIRKNLDSSEDTSCLLSDEIERLELYLSLELMRFPDKFEFSISVDDDIEPENIYVPSMLLQPFVENSIWHGILPSGKKGLITIEIIPEDEKRIRFIIKDDGIGIEQSLKAKTEINNQHNSKGMKITADRVSLLQKMTGLELFLSGPKEIKRGDDTLGTIVEMVLPRENAELYY